MPQTLRWSTPTLPAWSTPRLPSRSKAVRLFEADGGDIEIPESGGASGADYEAIISQYANQSGSGMSPEMQQGAAVIAEMVKNGEISDATGKYIAKEIGSKGGSALCMYLGATAVIAPLCAAVGGKVGEALYPYIKKGVNWLYGKGKDAVGYVKDGITDFTCDHFSFWCDDSEEPPRPPPPDDEFYSQPHSEELPRLTTEALLYILGKPESERAGYSKWISGYLWQASGVLELLEVPAEKAKVLDEALYLQSKTLAAVLLSDPENTDPAHAYSQVKAALFTLTMNILEQVFPKDASMDERLFGLLAVSVPPASYVVPSQAFEIWKAQVDIFADAVCSSSDCAEKMKGAAGLLWLGAQSLIKQRGYKELRSISKDISAELAGFAFSGVSGTSQAESAHKMVSSGELSADLVKPILAQSLAKGCDPGDSDCQTKAMAAANEATSGNISQDVAAGSFDPPGTGSASKGWSLGAKVFTTLLVLGGGAGAFWWWDKKHKNDVPAAAELTAPVEVQNSYRNPDVVAVVVEIEPTKVHREP